MTAQSITSANGALPLYTAGQLDPAAVQAALHETFAGAMGKLMPNPSLPGTFIPSTSPLVNPMTRADLNIASVDPGKLGQTP